MNRLLLVALVLASCSKAGKDAAPAVGATEPAKTEPTGGEAPGRDNATATELARNQGGLGVSAETTAFDAEDPEEGSKDPKTSPPKSERRTGPDTQGPQPVTGGVPTYVATIDSVTVAGKPAAAEITQAVKVASAEIQVCYDKARAKSPKQKDIAGTLTIAFMVLKTGRVASTSIEGKPLGEFEMENCVMEALMRMKVARPSPVKAVVTITFAKK